MRGSHRAERLEDVVADQAVGCRIVGGEGQVVHAAAERGRMRRSPIGVDRMMRIDSSTSFSRRASANPPRALIRNGNAQPADEIGGLMVHRVWSHVPVLLTGMVS